MRLQSVFPRGSPRARVRSARPQRLDSRGVCGRASHLRSRARSVGALRRRAGRVHFESARAAGDADGPRLRLRREPRGARCGVFHRAPAGCGRIRHPSLWNGSTLHARNAAVTVRRGTRTVPPEEHHTIPDRFRSVPHALRTGDPGAESRVGDGASREERPGARTTVRCESRGKPLSSNGLVMHPRRVAVGGSRWSPWPRPDSRSGRAGPIRSPLEHGSQFQ